MLVEVSVQSVRASLMSAQRLVVLQTKDDDRYLPIWIGPFEADAIAMELQGMETPRPMSHDLLKSSIETLGARVARVVVVALRQDTFYANVILAQDGKELVLDARPSDSIALAVRARAPIFVDSSVLDRAGISKQQDLRETARERADEQSLGVFRDFIEELSFDKGDEDQGEDE